MTEEGRLTALSGILDRNGRWIEVADTKANIVLAFAIALATVVARPTVEGARGALDLFRSGSGFEV